MLSLILTQNAERLQSSDSYLLPRLDKIICKLHQFEKLIGSEFDHLFTYKIFPKGTCLCSRGLMGKPLLFLKEGIARVFLYKDGKEVTACFFFPGEFIDTYYNSCPGADYSFKIQLMKDSALYLIHRNKLNPLECAYPVLSDIEQLLLECHTIWVEHWTVELKILGVKEYYAHLMKSHPLLIREIPVTYLASYLDVSLETLSRMRSQI